MCKLYKFIYVPQLFHEHKYNSKKEILLATCTRTCINKAPVHLLFKFDEFYISKGVLLIFYTISYTVVCGVSQFYPYNKDDNNTRAIWKVRSTTS